MKIRFNSSRRCFCVACWVLSLLLLLALISGPSAGLAESRVGGTPAVLDLHFSQRPFARVAKMDPVDLSKFEYLNCTLGIAAYRGSKVFLTVDQVKYAIQRTESPTGDVSGWMNEHVILGDTCPATSLVGVRQFELVFDRIDSGPSAAPSKRAPAKIVVRMFPQSGRVVVEEIIATDYVTVARGKIREYYP